MSNTNRLDTWIVVVADPFAKKRGYSLLNKEFKVEGSNPVQSEMKDLWGETMNGNFWVVSADEVFRVCPELRKYNQYDKAWMFPVEFCRAFYRPYYFRRTKLVEISLPPPDDDISKRLMNRIK